MLKLACSLAALLLLSGGNVALAQSFEVLRDRMVDDEIVAAGVKNPRVIAAMRATPRHEFVSARQRKYAYLDMALPIGEGQTISPPFVVAYMTEQIDPQPTDKVLEIGTGSGYQAAVLSPLVNNVYSIEIVESLGRQAERVLDRLDYKNVHTRVGDGYKGWPEQAPFDKIIVTCSPERVPAALVRQLAEGGMMVVPVGERYQQNLYLFEKKDGRLEAKALRATLFVPMTGLAESRRQVQPDPLDPQLANGSFEELLGEEDDFAPAGWHYQRQLTVVDDPREAREGELYVTFTNDDPGRASHALQGFAVDGRQISELAFSLWVRGEGLRYGQNRRQWPRLVITFYDESRAVCGTGTIGPWMGSFDWQRQTDRVAVPLEAREAIIHLGLLGGIGQISFDDLKMTAGGQP